MRTTTKTKFWSMADLDEDTAEIRFYGQFINENDLMYDDNGECISLKSFQEDLAKLEGKKNAVFRFNSVGGDFFTGLAIASQIKQLNVHTTGIIEGLCASAATLPAMAVDELHAMPGTLFMYHEVTTYLFGSYQVDDLKKELRSCEGINHSMAEMYQHKIGGSVDKILRDMKKETWLTADQAAEAGFVDMVLDGEVPRMAASADRSMLISNGVHIDVSRYSIPEDIPTNKRIHSAKADENKPAVDGGDKKEVKHMTIEELRANEPELVEAIENAAVEAFAKAEVDKQAGVLEQAKAEAEMAGHDAGLKEGAEAALARYAGIKALVRTPEDEPLADKAIREGLTEEQFAIALVESDRAKGVAVLENLKTDASAAKDIPAAPHDETDNCEVDPFEYGRRLLENIR